MELEDKMRNRNICELLHKVKSFKNFDCRKSGATESEIEVLESKLRITLPNEYHFFLNETGFISWFGGGVQGLPHAEYKFKKYSDVIISTMHYRKLYDEDPSYLSVPNEGVVINSYDGGGYYFLFSKESKRAGEVGLFLTETFGQEVSSFASFTDYLSFLVTGTPDPAIAAVDYDKINDILKGWFVRQPTIKKLYFASFFGWYIP